MTKAKNLGHREPRKPKQTRVAAPQQTPLFSRSITGSGNSPKTRKARSVLSLPASMKTQPGGE